MYLCHLGTCLCAVEPLLAVLVQEGAARGTLPLLGLTQPYAGGEDAGSGRVLQDRVLSSALESGERARGPSNLALEFFLLVEGEDSSWRTGLLGGVEVPSLQECTQQHKQGTPGGGGLRRKGAHPEAQIQDLVGLPGPHAFPAPTTRWVWDRTHPTTSQVKKHVKMKPADWQNPFPQATRVLVSRTFFLPFQGAFAVLQDAASLGCQEVSSRVQRSVELECAGSETTGHPTTPNLAPLATGGVSYTNLSLDSSSHSKTQEDVRSCPVRARRDWDRVRHSPVSPTGATWSPTQVVHTTFSGPAQKSSPLYLGLSNCHCPLHIHVILISYWPNEILLPPECITRAGHSLKGSMCLGLPICTAFRTGPLQATSPTTSAQATLADHRVPLWPSAPSLGPEGDDLVTL